VRKCREADFEYPPERIAERRAREAAPEPAEAVGTRRVSAGTVKYWRTLRFEFAV